MTVLCVSEDLLDARMRHASSSGYGSLARSVRDCFANSDAPLLLATGAARGGPPDAGETVHLANERLAPLSLGAHLVDRVGVDACLIGGCGVDANGARPVAEVVVVTGLLDEFSVSGHMARIVAIAGFVKGLSEEVS